MADVPNTVVPYGSGSSPGVIPVTHTGSVRIHYTVNNTNHTFDADIILFKDGAEVRPANGSPPYEVEFKPGETRDDYINALCGGLGAFSLNPTGSAIPSPSPQPRQASTPGGAAVLAGSQGIAEVTLANGTEVALWTTGAGFKAMAPGQTANAYSSGPTPENIVTGDFNGDGIVDVAVSNYGSLSDNSGGNIRIFLGKGDGTFTPGVTINLPNPTSLFIADFNGDHKLDLVASNVNQSTVSVMLGNGDGTFQSPQAIAMAADPSQCTAGGSCFPSSIVAADFNGDGFTDMAVGLYNAGTVAVFLGKGNGTFQSPVAYAVASGHLTYLAAADATGDGKLDLIAASPDNDAFAILAGKGDGTFLAPTLYVTGAHPAYFGVYPASDGIVVTTSDFITGDLVATPVAFTDGPSAPALYAVPHTPTGIAAGDLNGDGLPDIVAADGAVSVLLRNPQAQFSGAQNYTLQSGAQAVTAVVGDFNGDARNDVAVAGSLAGSSGGTVDVLLGTGNGSFGKQASYPIGGSPSNLGSSPSGLIAADFNGDHNLDVAAGYQASFGAAGGFSVLLGNGDGTLQKAVNYPASNGQSVLAMAAGDFNGDGKTDLAIAAGAAGGSFQSPGAITIWTGKGDGTFAAGPVTQAGTPAGTAIALAAADLDGDGHIDLVASVWDANLSDSIVILLGKGDGTFRQLAPLTTGAYGQTIALADLNGDGKPDLIVGDCCGVSEAVYLLGKGDGTFQPPAYFSSGASIKGFATASWNGDGVAGVAVAHGGGTVMALESALNAKFSLAPQITSVENAAGGASVIAPNTWVEIDGTGLAPAGDARQWQAADFANGVLPDNLDGVEVTVNGKAAYVYYISPTQIDVLTPPDQLPSNSAQVTVINHGSVSAAFQAQTQPLSPSFFVYGGTPYVAATHSPSGLVAPSTLYPGTSTPAKPGETIALYANGFGATSQAVTAGSETQGGTLSPLPVVTIGGLAANVTYAGLVVPGEFQINVTIPATLPDGDQPLKATYNGASTQSGVLIPVHQ